MSTERPGCLLLFPLVAIASVVGGKRQIAGPTLPVVPWARIDPADRPAVQKARAAAEAAVAALGASRKDLAPAVIGDVSTQVGRLLGRVIAVAEEIARARAFVRQNDPAALGKERAEIEVRAVGVGLNEKRALDETLASLADRARHAATVSGEIGVLQARLLAAVASMESLTARLQRAALTADEATERAQQALADLKAQEHDAERALAAYAATAREIARLSK
jgi:hypothetical protein